MTGTLNAARYRELVLGDIRETCTRLAAAGRRFIFQQDKAPAHWARTNLDFLARNQVPLLDWPGNSPDLNPIEHLWAAVQMRLPRRLPANADELWQQVQAAWQGIPVEMVRRLIRSMPARIQATIDAKGGPTRY